MKKLFLLLIALLLAFAFYTNPNPQQHKDAVKEKVNTQLNKTINDKTAKDKTGLGKVGNALGKLLGGKVIDGAAEKMVTIDNYYLFSTTKIKWEGEENIVGFGAFGKVFITKEIDKFLEENLP